MWKGYWYINSSQNNKHIIAEKSRITPIIYPYLILSPIWKKGRKNIPINIILTNTIPSDLELCLGDVNEDDAINILDIIQIVQWILNPIPESIRIDTGTSYGECWGYCIYQLIIENGDASFTAYNWWDDLSFPDLTVSESLSNTQWNNIINIINADYFFILDEEYGCPDCNDGGSEWI